MRCVRDPAPCPGATCPNSIAWMRWASATTSRPGRHAVSLLAAAEDVAGDRGADPQPARIDEVGIERPNWHARLDQRDQQRILERAP